MEMITIDHDCHVLIFSDNRRGIDVVYPRRKEPYNYQVNNDLMEFLDCDCTRLERKVKKALDEEELVIYCDTSGIWFFEKVPDDEQVENWIRKLMKRSRFTYIMDIHID